jgi:hypothetical protein
MLAAAQHRFAADYQAMLDSVLAAGLPTALCTIYDTPSTAPEQPIIRTALSVFNDVITRAAFAHGLALIDLRLIYSEDEDYANPIEPSAGGSQDPGGDFPIRRRLILSLRHRLSPCFLSILSLLSFSTVIVE